MREAKSELIRMSNNEEQRAMYEMRAKKLNLAKALLDILDNETIALKTGLSKEEIAKLR